MTTTTTTGNENKRTAYCKISQIRLCRSDTRSKCPFSMEDHAPCNARCPLYGCNDIQTTPLGPPSEPRLPLSRSHLRPLHHPIHNLLPTLHLPLPPPPPPLILRILMGPVLRRPLLRTHDRRPLSNSRSPRRHYFRNDVLDVSRHSPFSDDSDDVAGAEGGVGVRDEVGLVA